jgi:hypothetical protein
MQAHEEIQKSEASAPVQSHFNGPVRDSMPSKALATLLFASSPALVGARHGGSFAARSLSRQVQHRRSGVPVAQDAQEGQYANLVAENRMITIEESNLRYAGAFVILLIGIFQYVGMQAAGIFDYNNIAASAAGAWLLFETGRKSI